jgi:hypothetical protein
MIRYLRNNQIDRNRWDDCIRKAFNGNVYAFSWYLDIVAYGWEALVSDDYDAVLPLTGRKKAGIHYLYQPLFTQQLGVFSTTRLDAGIVNEFLNTIPGHYRYARINLNRHNKPDGTRNLKVFQLINIELTLVSSIDEIRNKYSLNTRRNIRKAEKNQLFVVDSIKPDNIIELFRAQTERKKVKWSNRDYQMLTHLMYTLIHKGVGYATGVFTPDNQIRAAAFFCITHDRMVMLLSAVTAAGRQNGAMHFLIDDTIARFNGKCHILDFEGSNDPGLARFYESFGSEVFYYPMIELDRLPMPLRFLYKFARKLRL